MVNNIVKDFLYFAHPLGPFLKSQNDVFIDKRVAQFQFVSGSEIEL